MPFRLVKGYLSHNTVGIIMVSKYFHYPEFARLLVFDMIYSLLPEGFIWSSLKRNEADLALNIFLTMVSVNWKQRIKHWLRLLHNTWPKWDFHVCDLSIEHLGIWFWWMNLPNFRVLTFTCITALRGNCIFGIFQGNQRILWTTVVNFLLVRI